MAQRADLIKVSDQDLTGLFRTHDPAHGLKQLRAMNAQAPIMVTKGEEGAEMHVGGNVFVQRSPKVEVIDTVGAGDASIGGLLYSVMSVPDASWASSLALRRGERRGSLPAGRGGSSVARHRGASAGQDGVADHGEHGAGF